MLDFKPPTLADADAVRDVGERTRARGNDLNFANVYLLRNKHRTTICFRNGFLFRRYDGTRFNGYAVPLGVGDVASAIREVFDDAEQRGRAPNFCLATKAQADVLEALYPGKFAFSSDPGDSDYLYLRENLASTPGRRYHRKRNAIKRFEAARPNWRFAALSPDTISDAFVSAERILHDVADVAARWFAGRSSADVATELEEAELLAEQAAFAEALNFVVELNLRCGVLYVDSAPVAATVVSATNSDVFDVHFEKAVPEAVDAYPLVCREAARSLNAAETWVNREEDLNVPGLRKAKESWFPGELLIKFNAIPIR